MQAMGTQCKLVVISYSLIVKLHSNTHKTNQCWAMSLNGLLNEAAGSFDLVRTHDWQTSRNYKQTNNM